MPEGLDIRWPKFYKAVTQYKVQGRNRHDDALENHSNPRILFARKLQGDSFT
jgi:hypothetical protein